MWLPSALVCGLVVLTASLSVDKEQKSSIQVELIEWDIEEEGCEPLQTADWEFLLRDTEGYVDNKIEATLRVGALRRKAAEEARPYLGEQYRSTDLGRRVELLARPGTALLPEEDLRTATEFTTRCELKQRSPLGFLSYGPEQLENVMLAEVPGLLAKSRDQSKLENLWRAWQRAQRPSDLEAWPVFLGLVLQGMELNDATSEEEYWELLSDWPQGYSKSSQLWKEIEPLYLKFHGYVRRRLQIHYKDVPDLIPVHLLGSPLGKDWSHIADLILPQPEIYTTLEASLQEQNLAGERAYAKAQEMTETLGLPILGTQFAEASVFNGSCPPVLFPGCSDEEVRVFTCNRTSWQDYLDAHETVFRATHYVMAAGKNSFIFRQGERTSGVSDAVAGLGSLLASTQLEGLLARDGSDPLGQDLNLRLLIALRVLPRLAYLLSADQCRLSQAPHPPPSPALCWRSRKDTQRVAPPSGGDEDEIWWDVLGDSHFTSNKPYLSEFAGLVLQFQLLDSLTETSARTSGELFSGELVKKVKLDDKFRTLLSKGLSDDWLSLLREYGIDGVKSSSLLQFFSPLLPLFEDMSPVSEIPDYEVPVDLPSSFLTMPSINETSPIDVFENSTMENENIELPIEGSETSRSQSTTFIAFAGVILGVSIVVASVFIVNRRRKSRVMRHNSSKYEAVLRHSAGRPASFSPVVAKRLSENDAPPLPKFTTFREIDLEGTIDVKET